MRFLTHAALLALALVTGCASTPPQGAAPAAVKPLAAAPTVPSKKVVLNMTGPANVTQAKDWSAFKEEWRATFAEHAKDNGLAFEMQQGDARSTGETGTLLKVYVNDYRMVGIGARIFFGVMTGNAYIDAKVAFADLAAGQGLREADYNTSSSAWSGVFGKMTPQQVDGIASQVFAEIKKR